MHPEYFEDMYRESPDPWGFVDRWYEERKRALTLALLPAARYAAAYEPGCSVGVLSVELAGRCETVLATDLSPAAVDSARARCAGAENVTVEVAVLPQDWPTAEFDLVVLSELIYYFGPRDARAIASRAAACAGTLVSVHWRHPVADYPLAGDRAHAFVAESAEQNGLTQIARYVDADFVAAVWDRDPRSVATVGGLT
jgi:SAM-dependent methyltransferase